MKLPAAKKEPAYLTKQEMVARTLRDEILRVAIPPGERLVIDELAARFAVSPIPVREALQQLQSERLVEIRPHAGAVVSPLSADRAEELFALMEALETAAYRQAAGKLAPEALDRLDNLIAAMERGRDAERWDALNQEFHLAICAGAGLALTAEMLGRALRDWSRLRRWLLRGLAPDAAEAQREHRAIVAALKKGDGAKLEALACRHNRRPLARALERLRGREG